MLNNIVKNFNLNDAIGEKIEKLLEDIENGFATLDLNQRTYGVEYELTLDISEVSQLIDLLLSNPRKLDRNSKAKAKYMLEIKPLSPMITDGYDDKKITIRRMPENSNENVSKKTILFA